MSSIQDIRALSNEIYNYVEAYQNGDYADEDVVVVSSDGCDITVEAGSVDGFKRSDNSEYYTLSSLMRDDENGGLEPDSDKIDDIANSWLFLN